MARIKIKVLGEGQHPSESLVAIKTADGSVAEAIIYRQSIIDDTIDVGYPVGVDGDSYLVELPQETVDGRWRIWVDRLDILDSLPI